MLDNSFFDTHTQPAQEIVDDLHRLFDFLNRRFFDDELPYCQFSLKRHNGTNGFYTPESYNREDGKYCDEITMNPAFYNPDNPLPFIEVLLHQMCHLWQRHYGTPGRGGYHNRELANKMLSIGLQPSSTGIEGGKETGDTMHQYAIPGSSLERVIRNLINDRVVLRWQDCYTPPTAPTSLPIKEGSAKTPKADINTTSEATPRSGKRYRYTCPSSDCKMSAESFHGAEIGCWIHKQQMVLTERKKRRHPN